MNNAIFQLMSDSIRFIWVDELCNEMKDKMIKEMNLNPDHPNLIIVCTLGNKERILLFRDAYLTNCSPEQQGRQQGIHYSEFPDSQMKDMFSEWYDKLSNDD